MSTGAKAETHVGDLDEKSMSELTNELAFRFETQLQVDGTSA